MIHPWMSIETHVLRVALLTHVLNWFVVFSPIAERLTWLTWALWILVPVAVGVTLISVSRIRQWTSRRGLLFTVVVLNGASMCLLEQFPIGEGALRTHIGFFTTSLILPVVILAELTAEERRQAQLSVCESATLSEGFVQSQAA
jgi:hypothetical protein